MNDVFSHRDIIFHRARQRSSVRLLGRVVGALYPCRPVQASLSLALEAEVLRIALSERGQDSSSCLRFPSITDAVDRLQSMVNWDLLVGGAAEFTLVDGEQSGFLSPGPDVRAVLTLFGVVAETMTLLAPDQDEFHILDDVRDDPVLGDFVELEVLPVSARLRELLGQLQFDS